MLGADNNKSLGFGNYVKEFHCVVREDEGLSFVLAEPVVIAGILHFMEGEEEIAYDRMVSNMEQEFKESKGEEKQDG